MLKMTLLTLQRLFKSVLTKINAPDADTRQLCHHWRLGLFEIFDINVMDWIGQLNALHMNIATGIIMKIEIV